MFKKENLRKNFLRVKQNIDQNLGRSEKSEVLSEDQQENEKRVDVVKHAFQNIAKKSGAVLQAQGSDRDPDKRLRKLPETGLGHALQESAHGLGIESLLGHTCNVCGDCQGNLAKERVQFESVMEQEFIKPLNNIVDVDIPSIIKQRKVLNKSILDMDSAKSRFHQAVRQSSVPGANMSNAATKVDGIREELDEAESKVETNKDNLSIELCNFTAKESEHAYLLLGLLEAQANYHRRAIETIEACIPQLRLAIQNSPAKPCYGLHLEEHLRLTGRDIAVVLEACVLTLFEIGLEEEGLFRVAGSANKVKKLKASFDAFPFDANALDVMVQDYGTDPFAVAGALKQYLRELPEPLLTFALHDDFMHAATLPPEQRLTTLWTIINRLPLANYNNFRYLIKFLAKLKDKSDVNKMKASNIAIVVGPNLLWSEGTDTPSMITTGTLSTVIEAVVTHADYFYPGDYNFKATKEGSCPKAPTEPPKLDIPPEKLVGIGGGLEKKQSLLEMIQPKHKQSSSMENLCDSRRPQFLTKGQTMTKSSFSITKPEGHGEGGVKKSLVENSLNSGCVGSSSSTNSLNKLINDNKGIRERGHTLPTQVSPSSYDTGDYDNIMFTSQSQSPLYRSSTVTSLHPLKDSSNTTNSNQDSQNTKTTKTTTTATDSSPSHGGFPMRPSRPSKKTSPASKLTQNFLRTAGTPYSSSSSAFSSSSLSQSESPLSSGLLYQTRPFRQDSSRSMTGSIPNISSSSAVDRVSGTGLGNNDFGGPMDLSLSSSYQDTQRPFWNRPNQTKSQNVESGNNDNKNCNKSFMPSSYNSAKRGSAPTIIAPPSATFSQMESHPHASYHRPGPAKISRSQLGQPPAPKHQPSQHQPFDSDKGFHDNDTAAVSASSPSSSSSSSHRPLTTFTSAGVGKNKVAAPDYSTKVQAMWEDFSNMSANETSGSGRSSTSTGLGLTTFVKANESLMKDEEKQKKRFAIVVKDGDMKQVKQLADIEDANADMNPCGSSSSNNPGVTNVLMHNAMSPPPSSASTSSPSPKQHGVVSASSATCAGVNKRSPNQELNFNVSGYDEDHEHFGPNPIMNTSHEAPTIQVPSPGPYSPQPISPKSSSPASLSVNISSDGSEATSPVQRRVSRKPAPPPPPERPFNVMVTATTNVASAPSKASSDGNSNNSSSSNSHNYSSASDDSSSLSWPQPAPLASPESPTDMPSGVPGGATTPTSGNTLERHQQHRISGGGGVGHVDRPSMPPPERPKLPPPVTIPPPGGKGHQRSASTGAMMNTDLEGGSSSATKAGLDLASDNEDDRYYASIHL